MNRINADHGISPGAQIGTGASEDRIEAAKQRVTLANDVRQANAAAAQKMAPRVGGGDGQDRDGGRPGQGGPAPQEGGRPSSEESRGVQNPGQSSLQTASRTWKDTPDAKDKREDERWNAVPPASSYA